MPTRVQVTYRLQWAPSKPGDVDEQTALITKAHQALYDLAAHECDRIHAIGAGACRLTAISVDGMLQSPSEAAPKP